MRKLKHLFAHDFCGEKPLRLIRQVVGRVQRVAFGQVLQEQALEHVDVGAIGRRYRHDFHEREGLLVMLHHRQQFRLGDEVHLVQHQDDRQFHVFDCVQQELIAGTGLHGRVDDQGQHVDLAYGIERGVDHPHVHAVLGLVDAGGIYENNLPLLIVPDAEDARPRRLRLVGNDGKFLADQSIEESGFTGVGPAKERDEAGLHIILDS